MASLKNKEEFFKEYNILEEDYEKTNLEWGELGKIFESYCLMMTSLESTANYISEVLRKAPKVHSVRARVKNPEHLIEKIIRKKINDPTRDINLNNYVDEIQDLIGIRVLHLFKEDWLEIHNFIENSWIISEGPIANVRQGDNTELYEEICKISTKEYGYRSVHYVISCQPTKQKTFAEIQVRTLFEEAWSEIDHLIRYPYNQDDFLFGQYLKILNRLAGSADEMGSYLNILKDYIERFKNQALEEHKKEIKEKDELINQLKKQIDKLEMEQGDKENIVSNINKLGEINANLSNFKLNFNSADLEFLNKKIEIPKIMIDPEFSKTIKLISNTKFNFPKDIEIFKNKNNGTKNNDNQ